MQPTGAAITFYGCHEINKLTAGISAVMKFIHGMAKPNIASIKLG